MDTWKQFKDEIEREAGLKVDQLVYEGYYDQTNLFGALSVDKIGKHHILGYWQCEMVKTIHDEWVPVVDKLTEAEFYGLMNQHRSW